MSIHIEHLLVDLLASPGEAKGRVLWIADESLTGAELRAPRPGDHLDVLTNRCDLGSLLQAQGHRVHLSDFDLAALPVAGFQDIVYRVSKERPVVNHCINASFLALAPGGTLHLIGSKEEGIRTHGRHAEEVFGTPEHAKKRGDAYHIRLQKPDTDNAQALTQLDSKDYGHLRTCTVGDFHFVSKPGVFGWNKVDRGSAMLADYVVQHLVRKKSAGSVLDLGCGYGYLLLATAAVPFSARTATDNNTAAVEAARASFARAQLTVDVRLDDCGQALSGPYDWILCNPPFHQGFDINGALTGKFLEQMRRLLAPQGRALVVVNQFIPLERLAAPLFSQIELVSHEHGFKVLSLG